MRIMLLPWLTAALAPIAGAAEIAATAPAPVPAAIAPSAAETPPYQAGDMAPAGLLPTTWLRGEPVPAMTPGVTYVIVTWNTTGGHDFAPGYNIARAVKPFEGNPALKPIVVLINNKLSPEKMAKRLARPSQQTPFALGHALPGSDSEKGISRLLTHVDKSGNYQANTLVVRDGRILWIGEAGSLNDSQLVPFLKPDFNYEAYVKWSTAYQARTKELVQLIMKDLPAAEKAKDTAMVQQILRTIESEPDVSPFVFNRMCDAKCGIAMEKGDLAGAVDAMRVLSDKYPDSDATQAWVHKVVAQTEELYKPGLGLLAQAAERMAKSKTCSNPGDWWKAVAKYRRELGDLPGALAALEEAEKLSGPYRRLRDMKAATK